MLRQLIYLPFVLFFKCAIIFSPLQHCYLIAKIWLQKWLYKNETWASVIEVDSIKHKIVALMDVKKKPVGNENLGTALFLRKRATEWDHDLDPGRRNGTGLNGISYCVV